MASDLKTYLPVELKRYRRRYAFRSKRDDDGRQEYVIKFKGWNGELTKKMTQAEARKFCTTYSNGVMKHAVECAPYHEHGREAFRTRKVIGDPVIGTLMRSFKNMAVEETEKKDSKDKAKEMLNDNRNSGTSKGGEGHSSGDDRVADDEFRRSSKRGYRSNLRHSSRGPRDSGREGE